MRKNIYFVTVTIIITDRFAKLYEYVMYMIVGTLGTIVVGKS